MSTLQGMQRLLAERLGVDESEITPDRTLESFGIDSLGKLELLFHIEEAFLDELRSATANGEKALRWCNTDVVTESGELIARVRKQIYVRRKRKD